MLGCDRVKVLLMSLGWLQYLWVVKPCMTYAAHLRLMPINCLCRPTSRYILCTLHILQANYFRKVLETFEEIICTIFHRILLVKADCGVTRTLTPYEQRKIVQIWFYKPLLTQSIIFVYNNRKILRSYVSCELPRQRVLYSLKSCKTSEFLFCF